MRSIALTVRRAEVGQVARLAERHGHSALARLDTTLVGDRGPEVVVVARADIALHSGVARLVSIVADRLGHSPTAVTTETYQDVMSSMQRDAATRFDDALAESLALYHPATTVDE